MIAYRINLDESKYMSFLIKDDELLEKYNETWEKVSKSIKKEFDSEPVYKEKYIKTKIKNYRRNSTQIMTKIKYQKKILIVFAYQ